MLSGGVFDVATDRRCDDPGHFVAHGGRRVIRDLAYEVTELGRR
jgi:hypothetical protein